MTHDKHVREMYDSLTDDERAEVIAAFADEIHRGWVPKPSEVADVIKGVLDARPARAPADR